MIIFQYDIRNISITRRTIERVSRARPEVDADHGCDDRLGPHARVLLQQRLEVESRVGSLFGGRIDLLVEHPTGRHVLLRLVQRV